MRYDILGFGTGVGESFFLSDFFECGAKDWSCSEIVDWLPETLVFTGDTCPFQQIQNTAVSPGIGNR